MIAVSAVAVQRDDPGALDFGSLGRQHVQRQRRMSLGVQQHLVALMIGQLRRFQDLDAPFLRRRMRTKQLAQLAGELRLPGAALLGRCALKAHCEGSVGREPLDVLIDGGKFVLSDRELGRCQQRQRQHKPPATDCVVRHDPFCTTFRNGIRENSEMAGILPVPLQGLTIGSRSH
jgi:hypothetical protein